MIRIFADGADLKQMIAARDSGVVNPDTTNPTLMRKAGVTNYRKFAREVLNEIPDMPISFEVFADTFKEMEKQAMEIASWGENVYVKIPITNTQGLPTTPVIRHLSGNGVKVNVTAVLTLAQVKAAISHLSKETPSIVSVFAGRIADTGVDPRHIMFNSACETRLSEKPIQCLWASCREALNIIEADACTCDIITVPNDILAKLPMFGKDLTELSLDTVKMFYNDAEASGYSVWE